MVEELFWQILTFRIKEHISPAKGSGDPPPPPPGLRRLSCHSFLNHRTVYTSLEVVACWTLDYLRFFIGGYIWFIFRRLTSLDSDKFLLCFLLAKLPYVSVRSDFALVFWALGVGHSCPPYLGPAHVCARCRGVTYRLPMESPSCTDFWTSIGSVSGLQLDAQISVPCNLYGLVCDAVGSFHLAPLLWAPLFALLAPSLPLHRRPLRPTPRLLRMPVALRFPLGHSPPPPSEGRCRVFIAWVLTRSSIPLPFIRQGGGHRGLGYCGC